MRKKVIIPVIVIALLIVAAPLFFRHRRLSLIQNSQSQSNSVPISKTVGLAPTTVVPPAPASSQSPTKIVYADPKNSDVTLESVRAIVDPQGDIWSRQKAVRALPNNLSPEARKLLTEFLGTWHEEDENQNGHVLKNDIMDALVAQATPSSVLLPLFTSIYNDTKQNLVIRDYAVQHLSLLSERLDQPSNWDAGKIQTQKQAIQKMLWQVLDEDKSSIFGTALLGLTRLSESDLTIDRQLLGKIALKAASAPETQEAARITAFQVCARLHLDEFLPVAMDAAQNDSSMMVRVSAVGALGLIGNSDQAPVLKQIAETNPRLKPVVLAALKRIQENQ